MAIVEFPAVEDADEHGLLAIGGDLEVPSLLLAYRSGIFPWPVEEGLITWFAPPRRAVLFLDEFHASRSLQKVLRKGIFEVVVDRNFEEVMLACSEVINRGNQRGTWITSEIKKGYLDFHRAGYAHSIECYHDRKLVGGLYGVSIGKMFAGESMFYRMDNASKVTLATLVEMLRREGVSWIDCQVMTPFLESMGAREIPRPEFMDLLAESLEKPGRLFHS